MSNLKPDERYMAPGTSALVSVANADDVRLTFSLTMTAPEWRRLMRELPDDGTAAGHVHKMIRTMLGAALGKVDQRYEVGAYHDRPASEEA